MNDDLKDAPEGMNFFSKRAKFTPKMSAEKLQAASRLLEEIHEEKKKHPLAEDIEYVPAKRPARGRKKRSVKNNKTKETQQNDKTTDITPEDSIQESPSPSVLPLSSASVRRLRKLQRERDQELKCVEDANQKILSSLNVSDITDVEDVDVDSSDTVNVLTISYLSDIFRLKCQNHDKFSTIFPKVADLFKLKVSEFLLCLRDKTIKLDDTPKSLNIVQSDILECIPYKAERETGAECDENKLNLVFQASDSKTRTEIIAHKLEKMQDIMEKYSKMRNIPLDRLSFEFDGEQISGSETPQDMDMESGNCIDVRILTADGKSGIGTRKKREYKEVITVDSDSNDSDIILCN